MLDNLPVLDVRETTVFLEGTFPLGAFIKPVEDIDNKLFYIKAYLVSSYIMGYVTRAPHKISTRVNTVNSCHDRIVSTNINTHVINTDTYAFNPGNVM